MKQVKGQAEKKEGRKEARRARTVRVRPVLYLILGAHTKVCPTLGLVSRNSVAAASANYLCDGIPRSTGLFARHLRNGLRYCLMPLQERNHLRVSYYTIADPSYKRQVINN